jgi:hypothetical protein
MSHKNHQKKNLVEKLFKLLIVTLVCIKLLSHFKFNINMGPIMKVVEIFILLVWGMLMLKDKGSQKEFKLMLLTHLNPFSH